MTANNTAAAALPDLSLADVREQAREFVRSSTAWLHHHWLQILIAVAVGTAIALALFAARRLGEKLARRSRTGTGWPATIGTAIHKTGTFFIVTLSARLVSGYARPPEQVAETIRFLFTIAGVIQAAVWARELILGAIEHRTRTQGEGGEALTTAMGLIRVLVTFAVFAVALVVVLDNLGVNVTGLIAGLGVGGIAIGLAAQGIFADLFAALAIIFDRPFHRGDAITYDKSSGTVEAIGLKSTRIRGLMGEERIIANKQLLDKEIQNNTRRERRRTTFTLGLAYQTPVEVLDGFPAAVRELVEAHGFQFVRCGFCRFGASALEFDIEFDSLSADYEVAFAGRHAVGLALLRLCREQGIAIPYPTQTTYTAAPDGTLVMPYAQRREASGERGAAGERQRTSTAST